MSGLSRKVEEIIDHYLALEEFFLRRSVDKAMKIDEYDFSSQTSSCVDDVFYILKKTILRAVYTSNVDCLAAMINFIKNTLEMDYISVFLKNMGSVFSSGDTKEARFQYMVKKPLQRHSAKTRFMHSEYKLLLPSSVSEIHYRYFSITSTSVLITWRS